MNEVLITIIESIVGIVSIIILTVFVPKLQQLIKAKTNNEKYDLVVKEIGDQVVTAIEYIEQTIVNQLKIDGKWNTETQREVLDTAVNIIKCNLSDDVKNYLSENVTNINAYLCQQIESHIFKSKGE